MSLETLLHEIYAGPSGPEIGAFFDYDGTVITGFSASSFYGHRIRGGEMGLGELAHTLWAGVRGVNTAEDYRELLDLSCQAWAGKTQQALGDLGRRLFKDSIAGRLHLEVWELVKAHHDMGHTVVLASSATAFQVEPMADALDAQHLLCTDLEVVDGVLTGRVIGTPLWGPGKADAVTELAAREGIDLGRSYGYSNGTEDVPFLSTVGTAVAVSPEPGLRAEAGERDWRVLECVPRTGRPSLGDVARTAGFYGAFATAFGTGLGLGLLNRNRAQVFDITGSVGSDVGLALAGVTVEVVEGQEHLWSGRPCVFVFNHQSKIDPVVVMKLLRQRWTGVAKAEAKKIPGFGQLFQIAGVAFVGRTGNVEEARQALAPAIAKVRDQGFSLALSPEGTRSPTPRLGAFKKGAFHIAMQAGVPMVPIVIRNAGDVMWRGAQTLRPGVVEVVVLPPVDTTDWRVESIDRHVTDVRDQFVRTLAHWPGRPRRTP
ncbi:HAD-IB family hydrolase [Nocardioides jensenii]|uniref:HAD-IB family hydrolase n=1 Tax=Nocardioides jensenii TaxID=1843 RepID=UPI000AE55A87|nr:HAD-IB family hydrolase [Nocardioides jensenii]